uniref:Ataxin-2 C-terminal domain-containing protein n=1 Tax=Ciona savignyi TaxID=51511 RepID=H2YML5_CIOSA
MKGPPETLNDAAAGGAVVQLRPTEILAEANPPVPNNEPINAQDLLEQYSWMAEAEEFDDQVLEQIKQDDFIEQCFEEMWKEEEVAMSFNNPHTNGDMAANDVCNGSLEDSVTSLSINDHNPSPAVEEQLNPNAIAFVPRCDSDS